MRFEFATATRIIFGPGTVQEVGSLAAQLGQRAFVVTGRRVERAAPVLDRLKQQHIAVVPFSVSGEPTLAVVEAGVEQARRENCDCVIAVGGGSVIDTGKAIAALLTNLGELLDYLEVIGRGKSLSQPAAPCVAIPTTAGTGAEVTCNAVMGSAEHRLKVSMRSPLMLPRLAVVDPLLTHSMPPAVTASTGLDALAQLMEAFVSNQASSLTDGVCREGLRRAARSLRQAYKDGHDASAREDMAMASLFGGLALANAKLGAVHGFAGPLGGMFSAPHGAICARLLPHVMEANVRALQSRAPNSPALARYDEVARILTGRTTACAAEGIAWTHTLCTALKVSPLSNFGLTREDFPTVVAKSQKASSMKGNPIALSDEELTDILGRAL